MQSHAQVLEDSKSMKMCDGRPLEAVITEKLKHPSLVAALGYATVAGRDPYNMREETWLLLQYCDRGSLIVSGSSSACLSLAVCLYWYTDVHICIH